MTTPECITCGHPALRPEGHASFCEPWNARNTAPTLTLVPTSAAPDSGSPADTVESGAAVTS